MSRVMSVLRAFGLACAITIAFTPVASGDEPPKPAAPVIVPEEKPAAPAAPAAAPEAKPEPDWVRRGLYFGPAVGVADADGGTEFGWALHALFRPFRYGGIQFEYFNLGPENGDNGDFDGLYLGLMPILPLADGFALFGQGGYAFSSDDDGGSGGAGVLYDLPLDWVQKVLPGGLTLRADYKYFDFRDGAHLATLGVMYRFGMMGKK